MDGTYSITQCDIPPNSSFTYNFTLQQSGTYWYHAHWSTTYQDGLFGPLIIHGRDEPDYNINGDFVLMVDDWYHNFSMDLLPGFFAPGNEGVEPVPDNGLINGYLPQKSLIKYRQNVFDCDRAPGYKCDNSSADYATFNVNSSSRYRFRIINTGAFADFKFSVDGHALEVSPAFRFDRLSLISDDRSRRNATRPDKRAYIPNPRCTAVLFHSHYQSDGPVVLDPRRYEH